jgi:cytochrome c peroxidase
VRKYGIIVGGTVVTLVCGVLAARLLLQPPDVAGQPPPPQTFGPIPCQGTPPDIIVLGDQERLGKAILYDCFLSDPPATLAGPPRYACAQCHWPTVGFTSSLANGSAINQFLGVPPGNVVGRFDNRRPMSYAYAAFSPEGPYFDNVFAMAYVGGDFWDGRVVDLTGQAMMPFLAANEMNNTPTNGIYPPVQGGYSALVAMKATTKYRALFEAAYGPGIIESTTPQEQYFLVCASEAAFESSAEVCQFSSKYDASIYGVPPQNLYTLTACEEHGRQLYFGNALCSTCHSSANDPPVLLNSGGKDTFTMYCFANVGVPRNAANPFYQQTNCTSNPHGCNPLGTNYVDFGLGGNPNPGLDGTRFYNQTPGDVPQFRGLFQTATTRNVDLRPSPTFVKAYMHNGVFKSLKEVVHFYNKRNIAVNAQGQEVAFDLAVGPPMGYTRLFPPPRSPRQRAKLGRDSRRPRQPRTERPGRERHRRLHEDP